MFLDCSEESFDTCVADTLGLFKECLAPLDITHEVPENGAIRFLDLSIALCVNHVCWQYEPRANKSLLPYHSAHSKLVKRGIVKLCISDALTKSCPHAVQTAFKKQVSRFDAAGYPQHLIVSVTEDILRKLKSCHRKEGHDEPPRESEKKKVAVVPYIHGLSHGLKKIANRVNVRVALSAPHKLVNIAKATTKTGVNNLGCHTNHRVPYVPCTERVVYHIPLTCGSSYVGQTGRCLNDRLREHNNNVRNGKEGFLALHCKDCTRKCKPQLDKCTVIGRSGNETTREIIEALEIGRLGSKCVSKTSITLSQKEIRFLSNTRCTSGVT